MKIGLVVPGFAADADDWCIPALTNLVRTLAGQPDVELHVFTLRYPHRQGGYTLHGAGVHAFGGAPIGGRRVWGASLGLLWSAFLAAVRREHARAPFAVLHGFWATESGYLAALAGRSLGVPTLVHLAGGELTDDQASGYGNRRPGLARLLVAFSLRLAIRLTVPSSPVHRQLRRYYPRYIAKAVPWAFGVDTEMFAPEPMVPVIRNPPSGLRLVHAASLVPVKDQALLLDGLAAARARAPEQAMTLTVAGAGSLAGALWAQAQSLGLVGVVEFVGEQRHDALPALYRAHDAFVLTSRHEAQCLAVLEAAACGLPWIGLPVGALADLAGMPQASGWCVPRCDPAALGAAILAATDGTARAARGAVARTAVAREYALDLRTAQLLELYKQLRKG